MDRVTRIDVKARKAYITPEDYWVVKNTVAELDEAGDPLANVKALSKVFDQADVDWLLREPYEPVAVVVVA